MISIIVPVYNVEDFLAPCLDSILNQTFTDYEVILVNDGSTDGSGRICDDYAEKDSRISVIHQANGGLPVARNAGLAVAKGDFIQFIDSDDMIHPAMLQALYDSLSSGDYDLSMVKGLKVPVGFQIDTVASSPSGYSTRVMTQEQCMRQIYGGDEQLRYAVVWNKLYRRELVSGLLFKSTKLEDIDFNNRVYLRAKRIIAIDAELYYWVQRGTSLMHSELFLAHPDRVRSLMHCFNDIPDSQRAYKAMCLKYVYKMMLSTWFNSKNSHLHDEACRLAKDIYRQTRSELIHSDLDWKSKACILVFYHCQPLYAMFRKLIKAWHKRNTHN